MTKRTVRYMSDPGHGWLAVKFSDLEALDILDKVSAYSYFRIAKDNTVMVYLEEDCDMPIFTQAAADAGWKVTIRESFSNKQSKIRNYASYPPGIFKKVA